MAHFRATIKGSRGEASRLGSRVSGLEVTANGWDDGVRVVAKNDAQGDFFEIWNTGGSNKNGWELIGSVRGGAFKPSACVVHDADREGGACSCKRVRP